MPPQAKKRTYPEGTPDGSEQDPSAPTAEGAADEAATQDAEGQAPAEAANPAPVDDPPVDPGADAPELKPSDVDMGEPVEMPLGHQLLRARLPDDLTPGAEADIERLRIFLGEFRNFLNHQTADLPEPFASFVQQMRSFLNA